MDIKHEYGLLAQKYTLPSYDELDKEFEFLYFTPVSEIRFVSRFVRRRICDRISMFAHTLQGLLQPNPTSFISLEESSFLTDEDKNKASLLIKELMSLSRESSLLDINFDEKKDAYFIREAYASVKKIRNDLFSLLGKVKHGWETKVKEESDERYFG